MEEYIYIHKEIEGERDGEEIEKESVGGREGGRETRLKGGH